MTGAAGTGRVGVYGLLAAALLPWSLAAPTRAEPRPRPERSAAFTPVIGSIVGDDAAPVRGSDGRTYLVYEVLLTNAKRIPAEIEKLEVIDADTGRPIRSLEGPELVATLRNLNVDPVEDASLGSSESRLSMISLAFEDSTGVPARITHRLTALAAASPGVRAPSRVRYDVAPLVVSHRPPPVLRPPLRGDGWLAVNGCCEGGGAHRGAIQTVNGRLWDSQRFAIDWMRLDGEGRLFSGGQADARAYAGYGAPVHAAAEGVVVAALDGLDDQKPGTLPDPTTITLATVDGNHVVLDHGGGVHTFYAHLQKGSVAVETGARVKAGDRLGRVGNTGNTSAPHLHFHVMTGPEPLGSDGIAFRFDAFATTRRIDDDDLDAALDGAPLPPAAGEARSHHDEMPLDGTVNLFE